MESMNVLQTDATGRVIAHKNEKNKTMSEKNKKMKDTKLVKSEHDKWKDIRETRKFKDVSDLSYWKMISSNSIL